MRCLYPLRVLIAAAVLLGLGHVTLQLATTPEDRLYVFIYERGWVQYMILTVAAIALVLLYSHGRQYAHLAGQFRSFCHKLSDAPEPLANAIHKVSRFLTKHGPAAALAEVDRFGEDQSAAVEREYEVVQVLVFSLPVLGLVGTILGLSDSLYDAFSRGFGPDTMSKFVAGLATALDTTVLGMVCMAPLLIGTGLQRRAEIRLVEQYGAWLRERFGLGDVPRGENQSAYILYAQLQQLTQQIGQQANAAFAEVVKAAAAMLQQTLAEVVEKHMEERRHAQIEAVQSTQRAMAEQVSEAFASTTEAFLEQNRRLTERIVEALADDRGRSLEATVEMIGNHLQRFTEQLPELLSHTMADSLARIAQLVDRHHASLAEGMVAQMGRLETALRNRTPEEVIIRYRENGAVH